MQVICTDGTVFRCEGYELTEYGVVLYSQRVDPNGERYDSDPDQSGFVPYDRLWYILPDGVTPNIPGLSMAQGQPRQQPPTANHQADVTQPNPPRDQIQHP